MLGGRAMRASDLNERPRRISPAGFNRIRVCFQLSQRCLPAPLLSEGSLSRHCSGTDKPSERSEHAKLKLAEPGGGREQPGLRCGTLPPIQLHATRAWPCDLDGVLHL